MNPMSRCCSVFCSSPAAVRWRRRSSSVSVPRQLVRCDASRPLLLAMRSPFRLPIIRVKARHALSYSSLCLTVKAVIVSPRFRRSCLKYPLKALPTSGKTGSEITSWRCLRSRSTPWLDESHEAFLFAIEALAGPLSSAASRGPQRYLLSNFVPSMYKRALLLYSSQVPGLPSQAGTPSRVLVTTMVTASRQRCSASTAC